MKCEVSNLRNVVDTLLMADEIAKQGYLITSSELADLMDVNASAVTSRGENWAWRKLASGLGYGERGNQNPVAN